MTPWTIKSINSRGQNTGVEILQGISFPFSRGSSQPRDQTQVACIAGSFFTSWFTREAICVESPSKPRIVVLLLSCVWLFATPWIAACQAPCLSPSPGVCSESCSLSGWCYPIISSSVTPFSSCPQSFPGSVQFSRSLMSDPLRPHGLQHARLPCPSLSPQVCSNSCPLSQ